MNLRSPNFSDSVEYPRRKAAELSILYLRRSIKLLITHSAPNEYVISESSSKKPPEASVKETKIPFIDPIS